MLLLGQLLITRIFWFGPLTLATYSTHLHGYTVEAIVFRAVAVDEVKVHPMSRARARDITRLLQLVYSLGSHTCPEVV